MLLRLSRFRCKNAGASVSTKSRTRLHLQDARDQLLGLAIFHADESRWREDERLANIEVHDTLKDGLLRLIARNQRRGSAQVTLDGVEPIR